MSLTGRGILITGANQGLGEAIAEACLANGANLFLCARGGALLDSVQARLAAKAAPDQIVRAATADVGIAADVRRVFELAQSSLPSIDGVVNNAGVHGPKGPLEELDMAEWWSAIQTNLLGTAHMCREALAIFRKQGRGKIVNLSGGGATAPMPRVSAYAASKAAIVRLTETIAVETADAGIDINAVAPGAMNTRLLDDILEAGPDKVGGGHYERAVKQKQQGGASLETAAALCVFLLSPASDGITGRLLSAVWDPWKTLPERLAELRRSDIYTLRRIVPEDRGLKWE